MYRNVFEGRNPDAVDTYYAAHYEQITNGEHYNRAEFDDHVRETIEAFPRISFRFLDEPIADGRRVAFRYEIDATDTDGDDHCIYMAAFWDIGDDGLIDSCWEVGI